MKTNDACKSQPSARRLKHHLPQIIFILLAAAVCWSDRAVAKSSPDHQSLIPVRLSTDKDDYAPGSTVQITAHGYLPGETVLLRRLCRRRSRRRAGSRSLVGHCGCRR